MKFVKQLEKNAGIIQIVIIMQAKIYTEPLERHLFSTLQ